MASISPAIRRMVVTIAAVVVILLLALLSRTHRGMQHQTSVKEVAQQDSEPPVGIAIERDPENSGVIGEPTVESSERSRQQTPPPVELSREQLLEQVSRMRFANAGQQKEAFEFFWTPGLLLKEMLQEAPIVVYPNE